MRVAQKIRNRINRFVEGETFTYKQLPIKPQDYIAAAEQLKGYRPKADKTGINRNLL